MRFAADVHFARIDARGIVLDLQQDRYFGLGPRLAAAATVLTAGPPHTDLGSDLALLAKELLNRGILEPGQAAPPKTRPCPARTGVWASPYLDPLGQPLGWNGFWAVIGALTEIRLWLAVRPFRSTVAHVRRQTVLTRTHHTDLTALIDAFDAARPIFPVKPICRLDAMALVILLRRHGHACDLVFGARLDPFEAHCWAQQGEVVYREEPDRIAQYTPLLVA